MNNKSDVMIKASGIVKGFSWFDIFLFVLATPAASGIVYYSISRGYTYNGSNIALTFFFAMVLFLPICYLLAKTSGLFPRSGGIYHFVSRSFGKTIAFLTVWPLWLGYGLCIGMFGHIVVGILGDALKSIGDVYTVEYLSTIGLFLSSETGKVIGAIVWVFVLWFIYLNGLKAIKLFLRSVALLPLILTLGSIIYLFILGPEGWKSTFNNFFGPHTFENIMDLARNNNWQENPFSFKMTLSALVVGIWAFTSIEAINFAGGEASRPKISFKRGFILGWLAVGLLYILTAVAVKYSCGSFALSYVFLYENHIDALNNLITPYELSLPTLIMTTINSPFLSIIIVLGFLAWFFNSMPGVFIASSRLTLAFSLDNIFPTKLSAISSKGIPENATHLTAFVALFGIALMYIDKEGILGIFNFCFLFIYWIYGLSAMISPYQKRTSNYFLNSKKVFGIPAISLIGLIVFLEGWVFVFIAISNFTLRAGISATIFFLVGAIILLFYKKRISIN